MKFRKLVKFLTALAACSVCAQMTFAQSTEYTELLAKAKAYESNKEYFYAFATYYDAMNADPANASEALAGFRSLKEVFENGRPGKEKKYNQFTLHDGYESLIRNCDKYWTENYDQVYTLAFTFTKGSVDYKARTAEYNVEIIVNSRTQKFYDLMKPVSTGLEKAWVTQWEDIPKNYPIESYRYSAADTYAATKIATYNGTKNFSRDYNSTTKKYVPNTEYRDYYEASWIASEGCRTHNRARGNYYSDYNIYNSLQPGNKPLYSEDYYSNIDFMLADIRYRVLDLDGNEIIPLQPRHMLGTGTKETIKGVNADAMQCIDDGEFRVEVVNLYLPYGKPTNSDVEKSAKRIEYNYEYYENYPVSRKFVTSLSEISFTNPRTKTFEVNTELSYSENSSSFYESDTDYYAYRNYDSPAEKAVAIEITKKLEETYVPVESSDYIFLRGAVVDYRERYYSSAEKIFVPGLYLYRDSLNQNRSYYYDSDINSLAQKLGTSKDIIHTPDSSEYALIDHYYPNDLSSSYLIVRSRESLTEEVLKKEMSAPRFTNFEKNSDWTVYGGLESSFRFSLEGMNLTTDNTYIMLNDEKKISPAQADGRTVTFDIPVETLRNYNPGYRKSFCFYVNGMKHGYTWTVTVSDINPAMDSTTLSLSSSSYNRRLYIRGKNYFPQKSELKILVNGKENTFDRSSTTLTVYGENFTEAGEYKVELYYQGNLAKSWDVTVTE